MTNNKLVLGILAHVDAGKTTLSESLLFLSGAIRKLGRVDHRSAFLDTYELEKERGITIFSKQATLSLGDKEITLLDTPGHVDFSAEMERTLQVLDIAILVINGADGIQGHSLTLWKLLKKYQIPTFLFVNKMDQIGTDAQSLMREIKKRLSDRCIDFNQDLQGHDFYDQLAMCDERLLEEFLDKETIALDAIKKAIAKRKVFPVYFGSALKLEGLDDLITGLKSLSLVPNYPNKFGARIYKIGRDPQGNRLTYMKITGGVLNVKDLLEHENWQEKVDQIRIYSGNQYQSVLAASAGTICAVTGLSKTLIGEGLGIDKITSYQPMLKPVLTYKIMLPEGCDSHVMLLKLRQIEEEAPQLNIVWHEKSGEIQAQVMGDIELEILKSMILERFNIEVSFGEGTLVYKETIAQAVEGIGHFEPLRHYAEVHLLLEPSELGSGLNFASTCSEDILERNWQRLVLSHLAEKKHLGVLTGSEITDMKITLVTGRAHKKHTEGGDFRQATFRAVRQGLKKAKSLLLEPIYEFQLEIPRENLGRAMSDIQKMQGSFDEPILEDDFALLTGSAPVATMREYPMEVLAYTKGMGKLFVSLKGYEPCHNEDEVIEAIAYDDEADYDNPTSSIFCTHGSGFMVSWDQVEKYMHVESGLKFGNDNIVQVKDSDRLQMPVKKFNEHPSDEELEDIFIKTYGPIKRDVAPVYQRPFHKEVDLSINTTRNSPKKREMKEKYLLIDGYNIIFAWDDLKELARDNLDGARMKLMDMMCNYQSFKQETVIIVFDAYKVEGNRGEALDYHNIHIVYTKEAETADAYIERLVGSISHKYDVTVATSDALEQMIILGKGAMRLSARGLKEEIDLMNQDIRQNYLVQQERAGHFPFKDIKKDE